MNGVRALGFPLPDTAVDGFIYGIRALCGSRSVEARLPHPIAILVRREIFDHLLLEKAREAGATIRMEEKVVGLEETEHEVTVKTTRGQYRSRYVVLAYGATGLLSKRLPGPGSEGMRWKAVTRRYDASQEWLSPRKTKDLLEFYFDAHPQGYGWVFPLRDAYSIGVGGLHRGHSSTAKAFADFVRRIGGPEERRYHGSAIPCRGIAPVLGTRRILYAGDAGSFGEAFSGEGIYYAIRSGQIAAATITDALRGNLRHPLHQVYRSRCLEAMGDNLQYAALFARWVYRFPGFFVALFSRRPQWAQDFLGIPLGRTTYKAFLRKRLSLGLLGNSGR